MALPLLFSVLLFMQLSNNLIIQLSILSRKSLKIQRHAVRDFQQFLKTLFYSTNQVQNCSSASTELHMFKWSFPGHLARFHLLI